jgi:catechol 2,3-dioxygenase-like lactoylglutathione lyase family enzyme
VRDYDEAIAFFVEVLRFTLVEDTPLGGGKRWVVVKPEAGGALLLARAATPELEAAVGNQTGGGFLIFWKRKTSGMTIDGCRPGESASRRSHAGSRMAQKISQALVGSGEIQGSRQWDHVRLVPSVER